MHRTAVVLIVAASGLRGCKDADEPTGPPAPRSIASQP